MARLWKTLRHGSNKLNIYEVFVSGQKNRNYGYAALKNREGGYTLIKCYRSGEPISTRVIQGKPVLVPVFNPETNSWKFYKRTQYLYHVLPKITGRKVGVGYKNVRGSQWKWHT
jgi:hypothetical protein